MNDPLDEADLPLPPRRTLPPQVRARMRETVFRQLPGRSRLDRIRPPLAVAASVAVLAAGAMIVAQSVDGGGDGPLLPPPSTAAPTPEPPPLDPEAARVNLDRCATALRTAGKAADVPDRTTWEPVFAVTNEGRTVTATRANGKPLFCETTRTTVTVSDPNAEPVYATGSRTAALMISKDGGIGGVVDPSWKSMTFLSVSPAGASGSGPSIIKNGMFVEFSGNATRAPARFTVRQTVPGHPETPLPVGPGGVSTQARPGEVVPGQTHAELELPPPPPPLVSVTDVVTTPPPDRTSERGAFLGECIAKSDSAVVDPDTWEAVTLLGQAPSRIALARSGNALATCSSGPSVRGTYDPTDTSSDFHFVPAPEPDITRDQPLVYVRPPQAYVIDQVPVVGLVRDDVATMELITPAGTSAVPLQQNAFGIVLPGDPFSDEFTAVLRDATGKELYRGRLRNR